MNNDNKRKLIIEFLQWNDKNGCYTDKNCDLEDVPRMTYEEAIKYFFGVVNGEFYNEISESMADIEYDEVIKYAKDNSFYDITMEKLEQLVNQEIITNDFYRSLI